MTTHGLWVAPPARASGLLNRRGPTTRQLPGPGSSGFSHTASAVPGGQQKYTIRHERISSSQTMQGSPTTSDPTPEAARGRTRPRRVQPDRNAPPACSVPMEAPIVGRGADAIKAAAVEATAASRDI